MRTRSANVSSGDAAAIEDNVLGRKSEELTKAAARLEEIRKSPGHVVRVPLNSVGYFEGEVVQSERVFVDLGCQFVAECSADDAQAILRRKLAALGAGSNPVTEATEVQERPGLLPEEDQTGSAASRGGDKIWSMLEELERREKEAEAEVQQYKTSPAKGLKPGFLLPKKSLSTAAAKAQRSTQRDALSSAVAETVKEHRIPPKDSVRTNERPPQPAKKLSLFQQRLMKDRDAAA